jgi:RimJ/RimL family protein N-acetyltransferase
MTPAARRKTPKTIATRERTLRVGIPGAFRAGASCFLQWSCKAAWYERMKQDPTQLVWSIETYEGHLLGNMALHRGFRTDAAELGLFIGEKGEWSKGYGTDAVRTTLRHAFGQMSFRRIYLHTDVENQRAHRCFAQCGFRQEGRVKEYRRRWGEARFVDGLLMAILAREFTGELAV